MRTLFIPVEHSRIDARLDQSSNGISNHDALRFGKLCLLEGLIGKIRGVEVVVGALIRCSSKERIASALESIRSLGGVRWFVLANSMDSSSVSFHAAGA